MNDFQLQSFSTGRHSISWLDALDGLLEDAIKVIVAVGGVMMEGGEMFYISEPRELERVRDAAMTKTDAVLIFLFCILRVMDQQVGPLCQFIARYPGPIVRKRPTAE